MASSHQSRRLLTIILLAVFVVTLFVATADRAEAFLGGGMLVFDPKLFGITTKQSIWTKIYNRIKDTVKKATDIAFKNSTKLFLGRAVQQLAISLATTGPGQKPLFLTNPGTFFRDVGNAAAGDFIDGFQRGLTGGSLNKQGIAVGGQIFGRSKEELFSDAQQRFIISRILRAAAGDPVQSCQESCRVNYAVRNTNINEPLGALNESERKIAIVLEEIKKTEAALAKAPNDPYDCFYVVQYPQTVSGQLPYKIYISNTPWAAINRPKECLAAQTQAVNIEKNEAQNKLRPCLKECREGIPGASLQAINAFTATDIFSAVENADPSQAPAAVANALSRSQSGVGRLLSAAGALTATVQERILGEDTKLKSGVLPKTSPVSKKVQTPKEATSALFGVPFYNSEGQLTYTGTGVADILRGIASFLNSPIGRALTTYFKSKCGLNPDSCKGPTNPTSALGQLLFTPTPSGVAGAQLQFASLGRPELITGDPGRSEISVSDELTGAGLIDAQFRSAIEEQLTVRDALAKNLLDPKKTFGFDQNGLEPKSGYPYRALQYLRKYRVIPVGWELAAKYSQSFGHRALSLGFLTQSFNICGQDDDHKVCSGGARPEQTCRADNECGVDQNNNPGRCTASPYCGLVDPDWVLKVPQTYCRRQGAGDEIVSREFVCDQNNIDRTTGKPITPGVECEEDKIKNPNAPCFDVKPPNCIQATGGNDFPDIGRWIIERTADVCADTQSCIAENDDGTCQGYGYCVQERQAFKFNGTQCSAENATCTTYVDENGQNVSYLAKTLDFRKCSAENAGCLEYATQGKCSVSGASCFQDGDCSGVGEVCNGVGTIRFTGQVASCTEGQIGCRQYIRTTAGSNLLGNGNFETHNGTIDSGLAAIFTNWNPGTVGMLPVSADDPSVAAGNTTAVGINNGGTITYSPPANALVPLYEKSYTFSIRAKSVSACNATLKVKAAQGGPGLESNGTASLAGGGTWQTYATTLTVPTASQIVLNNSLLEVSFDVGGCGGAGLVIDSAQLEEGTGPTAYKDYGVVNNIFLSGKRQACTTEDIGCELYTPVAGGPKVTAVGRTSNRCSSEDVGCATYELEAISSEPIRNGGPVNIVAPRGRQCSAADVGCEEYTNLDLAAQGGEALEYFKSVKQCIKPSNTAVTIKTYYTWVGDPDQGFILRANDLVVSNLAAGNNNPPCGSLTIGTTTAPPVCNDTTNVYPSCIGPADLADNPDCGQYYDSALRAYYIPRSRTVSVTNDCHPYRNTIDDNDPQYALNKGRVYYLSTKENIACSAPAASCRAYTGNSGRTTRQIFRETLEPTAANWIGGTLSSASVNVGGHSLKLNGTAFTASKLTSGQFSKGKAYLVSFFAAAASNAVPKIYASVGTANGAQFNEAPVSGCTAHPNPPGGCGFSGSAATQWSNLITPPGPEWNSFTLGPLTLVDDPAGDLRLALKSTGDVYIDNIVLSEITDKLYLTSNSVPLCAQSEIGCAAYRDRQRQVHYFKSFTRICSEQVVGCEALIDTQNSSTPFAQTVKTVTTPADTVTTFVNDRKAYCPASAKGCDIFGRPSYLQDYILASYQPAYLKNDPDTHSRDLCLADEVSCQAYATSDGGAAFFKDPTNRTCDYQGDATTGGGRWVISGTTYNCPTISPPQTGRPVGPSCSRTCSGILPASPRSGKSCVNDLDCPDTSQPTGFNTCTGDASKVGRITGGNFGQCISDADCLGGNKCVYLAGNCPDDQNGCNEYRDPSDPPNCRSECPLELQGGSPIYMDAACQVTRCSGTCSGAGTACTLDSQCPVGQTCTNADGTATQNCQNNTACGAGSSCLGGDGTVSSGVPGCRSYFYLRQSVEDQSGECNGQVNLDLGCRPFNDTSNSTLNFRGQ